MATHAFAVATGIVEIEAGVLRTQTRDGTDGSFGITTKFGVATRLQLTITTSLTRASGGASGADPVFAGIKWQVAPEREGHPTFALLPGVTFANGPRRDDSAALSLLAVMSQTFGPVSVDLNGALTKLNETDGTIPYMWAASAGGPIAGPFGWGAELSQTSGATTRWLAYAGYSARPWLIFDIGASAAVHDANDTQLFAGLTWNAGRVHRPR